MNRNCHTCKHNTALGARPTYLCVMDVRRADVDEWTDAVGLDDSLMPPRDADGCPGYEAAAPMMGNPEDYTAQHVGTPPTLPHNRAEPIAHPAAEVHVPRAPAREWDADDDGRDL